MALGPVSGSSLPMLAPHVDGGVPVIRPAIAPNVEPTEPSAFQKLFATTLEETNQGLLDAEGQARAFAEGKSDDIHGTMIAVAEADIQLRLLGTMKNKVVDAFYELWRMQI